MRQLLTYWPPRIVSAKWTLQLSLLSVVLSAAAIPPSAITVCALPRSDLQTNPTLTPAADASIAARNPAPPAPMTSTSYSNVGYSDIRKFSNLSGFLSSTAGHTDQRTQPRRDCPMPTACDFG